MESLRFNCPRCGEPDEAPFYGPCASCVTALRSTVAAVSRTVAEVAYEPKMNVTPNAVALKD
ncbi:MAG: hypothetical protein FJW94_04405 [Actinobacteria bacterium]|nr:hypothetical protein [Actinomycetota bacterium]